MSCGVRNSAGPEPSLPNDRMNFPSFVKRETRATVSGDASGCCPLWPSVMKRSPFPAITMLFGSVNGPNTGAPGGRLISFSQNTFAVNGYANGISMGATGFAYVPPACTAGQSCRLLVAQIRAGGDQLSGSAGELLATAEEHAASATQQSSAVAETTSTIEELAAGWMSGPPARQRPSKRSRNGPTISEASGGTTTGTPPACCTASR